MSQTIALDKSIVSQGEARATLKFMSNSWGDGDYGTVYLIAKDKHGNKLEEKKHDTKTTSSKWLDNEIAMALPADSSTLTVQVLATKKTGTMSDVHFDDFVLKVDNTDIDEPDNTAPVAKASVDPTTLTGAGKITLSAAGSYDPDGDTLDYEWKQIAGPAVALNASNTMAATAQLNTMNEKTDYQFEVTVTDSHSAFSSHRVSVTQYPEIISAVPAWNASKTYSTVCEKVSWQGKEWLNGWWTQGNKPGSDGTWGVWRELGAANMHNHCK
ncbi:PKD domain-containing protein [Serratia proteamaculans]